MNYTISKNKPHMNYTFFEKDPSEEFYWACTIFSLVAAVALVVHNFFQSKKSYPFLVVGFALVTFPICFIIRAVMRETYPFRLSFFLELECCLIIMYSFTAINGLQKGNLIITIVKFIILALASAYPIVYMFHILDLFILLLNPCQLRLYCFAFSGGMGASAVILLWYGFISSRGKSVLNKIFCMQFGVICLLVGVSHFIFTLMIKENIREMKEMGNILYFMLITSSVFPLSCLGFYKGLKDNDDTEETDTLL